MEIKHEIRDYIIENFCYGQDDQTLDDNVSFLQNGIIDSTGVLELVSFIQDKYSIHVADDDLIPENLDSLSKVSAFIARKKKNGN
jgi:acyl carrier protein